MFRIVNKTGVIADTSISYVDKNGEVTELDNIIGLRVEPMNSKQTKPMIRVTLTGYGQLDLAVPDKKDMRYTALCQYCKKMLAEKQK